MPLISLLFPDDDLTPPPSNRREDNASCDSDLCAPPPSRALPDFHFLPSRSVPNDVLFGSEGKVKV